jgi:hypothetical protein
VRQWGQTNLKWYHYDDMRALVSRALWPAKNYDTSPIEDGASTRAHARICYYVRSDVSAVPTASSLQAKRDGYQARASGGDGTITEIDGPSEPGIAGTTTVIDLTNGLSEPAAVG